MILEGPWYAQMFKATLAILFIGIVIGTFVWKKYKKEWWWENLKKRK